ncbi:hypothetical protein FB451DRAFT_1260878 [Mycena latifolia]|nr:hypothetical protein FB451DRAFT_1260878 [Mycena latifolia]
MEFPPLSMGACEALSSLTTGASEAVSPPLVLQLLSVRLISSVTPPRYRVILSDGLDFFHAVLSRLITEQFPPSNLQKNAIVGVEKISWGKFGAPPTWLLVILEMHWIEDRSERIGTPEMKRPFP